MKSVLRFLTVLAVVHAVSPVDAQTVKCGAICNETWSLVGSPYIVTCDTTVVVACTLTIDAGVEVRFQTNTDLTVEGTLDVNGASGSPVLFTSDSLTPAAGDWDFIDLRVTGSATVDFATVEYADRGFYMLDGTSTTLSDVTSRLNNWGLWADTTPTLVLNNVTVEQSTFDGLRARRANITGNGNKFVNNNRYGVQIETMGATDTVSLRDGELHSNGSSSLFTNTGTDVARFFLDARNNWWGTTDPSAIAAAIFDHVDNTGRPVADHCDYLDAPGGLPVVDAYCPDLTICDATESLLLTDKPYLMTSDMLVCSTGTLEVGPGVTVLVDPHSNLAEILVTGGTVDVNGAFGSEASFTSRAAVPAAGDWEGFQLQSGAGGTFDFATVEYADRGIYLITSAAAVLGDVTSQLNTWGIWADTSTLTMTNVTSQQNAFDGLRARLADVTGTGNRFVNNNRYGANIEAMATTNLVSLNDGELHSNGSSSLFGNGGSDVARFHLDVRDNWWGATDPSAIGAAIRDHVDSTAAPVADHCGYLDGPGGLPILDAHCPDLTVCDGTESLTLTDKPYWMTSDMLVCTSGTLEVGPGVTLLVDPQPNLAEIVVNDGTLDVNGAFGSEALFTSRALIPAPGDWDGLQLQGAANGTLDFAIVEYADRGMFMFGTPTVALNGVTARSNTWGLWADTTTNLTMTGVVAETSTFDGLRVRNSVVSGSGNKFVNNTRDGVRLEAMTSSHSFSLNGGEIHSNGAHGLHLTGGIDFERFFVDVRNNWWGTIDPASIGAAIRDHTDVASLAVADRCIYLDGPGGLPEVDAHCPDLTVCDGPSSLLVTDKPYWMTADTVVCSSGILEVGPGVTVLVDPDPGLLEIAVDGGAVDVNGALGAEVTFTSRALVPASGDWDGFDIRSAATVNVDRALVEYADRGFFILDSSSAALDRVTTQRNVWGLWVDGAGTSATLNRVVSIENDFDGLRAVGPVTVTATGCRFVDNTRYGVYLQAINGNPDVGLAAGTLYGNLGGYDVYADSSWISPQMTILRATDNWWGTTDDVAIRARIRDYEDSTGVARIYHRAFGDACEIALGIDRDGDGLGDFEDICPGVADAPQTDTDLDEMGDACDPDPGNPPGGPCDGVNDAADGYTDFDSDGWGDPCDIEPVRADVYPGAPELCDGLDNDGDGLEAVDEWVDDDFDLGMLCGDCDDFVPAVNVCVCENCTNVIDDDCNGMADGIDSLCLEVPHCLMLAAGADPVLTMDKGLCGAANSSGPFDVIRGELVQVVAVSGSIDLGNVACVGDNVAWDRVNDLSANPTQVCGGSQVLFYLVKNDGASDFGDSSLSEPRDTTTPDPPCP
jgi:hypothetical protein